ncbi:MAG: type II toxin-antitoxin system death-on-curing family toxin [Oscillospiraceae bacterium]
MILLTVEEIISIHSKLISKTGGLDGIRDIGLLESAVFSANNSFNDIEQYPTIIEKSSRLAYAIVNNHAFLDGNKRIGILTMLMTLKLNGIEIQYAQKELIDLGLSIACDKTKYEDILFWIENHIKK